MARHDPALSKIFHALGDPTRREIVERLMAGPVSVGELAAPTGLALPTVLRHVAVLEDAGLLVTEKAGRVRTCRAIPDRLSPATHWFEAQRLAWEARHDRLEDYLATLTEGQTP